MMKNMMFINSWYESEHESAAMWSLYGNQGSNIAIISDAKRLHDALFNDDVEQSVFCGRVKYLDYEKEVIKLHSAAASHNAFNTFLRKRKSFEHEHEVRLMTLFSGEGATVDQNNKPNGLDIKVSLPTLVSSILVSPSASPWFVDAVKDVVAKYGLSPGLVSKSSFNDGPLY